MPTVTLKNVPPRLYARLKQSAALHRRSINSEAITCLEEVLGTRRVSVDDDLERIRVLRQRTAGLHLTDELLKAARQVGRR
jgi:plasmid stability protein